MEALRQRAVVVDQAVEMRCLDLWVVQRVNGAKCHVVGDQNKKFRALGSILQRPLRLGFSPGRAQSRAGP